jgi:AbrB family looped-hinge helix DNA binding protein
MSKVTSKLQVTVPKALAERYGIDPGDEIEWQAAGDAIRVIPVRKRSRRDVAWRLRVFDQASVRQRERDDQRPAGTGADRGWTREELYDRARSR